jgi:hypothetical protein
LYLTGVRDIQSNPQPLGGTGSRSPGSALDRSEQTMPGTWTPLPSPPQINASTMLLLTDGTVLCNDAGPNLLGSENWWILTPDENGSYLNGTWQQATPDGPAPPPPPAGTTPTPTPAGATPTPTPPDATPASTPDLRKKALFFSSAVLSDGRVFVAGGQYNGSPVVEDLLYAQVYEPVPFPGTWTELPTPSGWAHIGAAPCCVLPNGTLLLGSIDDHRTAIYDPVANSWNDAGAKLNATSSQETWTLLPDGTVLTVDCFGHPGAEKYVIASNKWVSAGSTSSDLVEDSSKAIGPALLLYDGRVFAIGATNNTSFYTAPAAASDPGSWADGPHLPAQFGQTLGTKNGPACLLPNGKILFVAGPVSGNASDYFAPSYFFEFDPAKFKSLARATLQVLGWDDGTGAPTSGADLVIVGIDKHNLMHIRVFDPDRGLVADTDETNLPPAQASAVSTLKPQLPGLVPPHVLTVAETADVINQATSIIAGQTPWLTLLDRNGPMNSGAAPFNGRMLLLPTGQVLFANGSGDIELYTPDGKPQPEWCPVIDDCPARIKANETFTLGGCRFNGLSQAVSYGAGAQMATNYPIVRIRNLASNHIAYCRTSGHSSMGVATVDAAQSTKVFVPETTEPGPSELVIVANGIASDPRPVIVDQSPDSQTPHPQASPRVTSS